MSQKAILLLLNYLGRLLSALNKLLLLPIYLLPGQLGLYGGIHEMVFFFVKLDLSQGIIRYGAVLKEEKKKKGSFLCWALVANTTLYISLMALLFLFRSSFIRFFIKKSPEVISYLPLIIFLGYIVLLSVTLKARYISLGKIILPTFSQHIIVQLLTGLTTLLYGYSFLSFHQLLLITPLPYIIHLTLLLTHLWRAGELRLYFSDQFFNFSFLRTFMSYSLLTLIAKNTSILMMSLGSLMVLGMCGKEATGIYKSATFIALLLDTPMKVVRQVAAAPVIQLLKEENYKSLHTLYQQTTVQLFGLVTLFFTLLYCNIEKITYAFSVEIGEEIKSVFLLLSMAKIVDSLFGISSSLLIFSRYFALSLFTVFLLPMGILANYSMIQGYGMHGAAIATIFFILLEGIIRSTIVWHKLTIHPYSPQLIYLAGITLFTLTIQRLMPPFSSLLLDAFLRTALVLAVYIGLASLLRGLTRTS